MQPKTFFTAFIALAFWILASPSIAQLSLPRFFTDHMVLQRDKPIKVWGWAEAGATVTVRLAALETTATAGADGRWEAT